ncbi:Uncharacterised protein [Mycobacteroides abscessus subsp. abscessus]|nr:Uncharacterised protein [Mycobacteroides abscessus subsp. abscessus]
MVLLVFVVDDDVVELGDQLRAGSGEGEDFEVAGQGSVGAVQGAPHPVRVVPPAGEAAVGGVLPRRPLPRTGCVPDPIDGRGGPDAGGDRAVQGADRRRAGLVHPTAANWRAALSTWGPTSARSPSRSSNAGARSSRTGLRPWNQACATAGVSRSVIRRAAR